MAEDLGHFTLSHNVVVETDRMSIKLKHPMSGDVILSLSTEAAWDLGNTLTTQAFRAERTFR